MKMFKFCLALLLLPTCVATALALRDILRLVRFDDAGFGTMNLGGLVIGFFLWIFAYLVMPRPTRAYILGHELTHLLWAWMLGIRASGLRINERGGSVRVERNHFLVTLAPYFFPLYTVAVIALRYLINVFYDTAIYEPFWLGCVGATWAFHLTFTLAAMQENQPDIRQEGRLFSYVIIYLFNAVGIALWIVLVARVPLENAFRSFQCAHGLVFEWEVSLFERMLTAFQGFGVL